MKYIYKLMILLSIIGSVFISTFAQSVKITSDAVGNKVEVGETFHITITATDCSGKLEVSQLPQGVKKLYQTSSSSTSQTIINGKSEISHSTSLIITCKGEKEGKYNFGPVTVDGKKSNTLSYQVIAPSSSKNTATGNSNNTTSTNSSTAYYDPNSGPVFVGKGNEEMFLKASVNKSTAFEQEAIEYTVKLYTTYGDIKFLGAASAPKFDGFVMEESSDISTSFRFEEYNGKTFKTAIIARYIIFPQKSGNLQIKGNTYTVSTDARQYYHDPYFQTMTVKYPVQLNVTPNDINIDVKELPYPIPENFMGGVGQFTMTSSLPSSNFTTNTPGSLLFDIQGTGNIKYIKLPDLSSYLPNSIEIYTPEISVDVNVGSSNVSGHVKFDYSIIPHEDGNYKIPSMEFSYFDPTDGVYKSIKSKEFEIKVSLGQSSDKSQQTKNFNPDLLPIGTLSKINGIPYVYTWMYWLWYIVPIVIFTFSLGLYRKYQRDHENITLLRSKNANKMALKRLNKAYQCIKTHQDEKFYDEMLAALWGYIGDKLKMSTSELNRSNVGEEFKKHSVSETTFMPIINLIDECEYAKYTPVSRDANMRQLYSEAVESLSKVESEYDEELGETQADDDMDASSIESKYTNTMKPSSETTQLGSDIPQVANIGKENKTEQETNATKNE